MKIIKAKVYLSEFREFIDTRFYGAIFLNDLTHVRLDNDNLEKDYRMVEKWFKNNMTFKTIENEVTDITDKYWNKELDEIDYNGIEELGYMIDDIFN